MESQAERVRLSVDSRVVCDELRDRLNKHLPEGLEIIDCVLMDKNRTRNLTECENYRISFIHDKVYQTKVNAFKEAEQWSFTRNRDKKRKREIDLKKHILEIRFEGRHTLFLAIGDTIGFKVRPADFLIGVLGMTREQISRVRVVKLMAKTCPLS